jgi:hypothetical protein
MPSSPRLRRDVHGQESVRVVSGAPGAWDPDAIGAGHRRVAGYGCSSPTFRPSTCVTDLTSTPNWPARSDLGLPATEFVASPTRGFRTVNEPMRRPSLCDCLAVEAAQRRQAASHGGAHPAVLFHRPCEHLRMGATHLEQAEPVVGAPVCEQAQVGRVADPGVAGIAGQEPAPTRWCVTAYRVRSSRNPSKPRPDDPSRLATSSATSPTPA